MFLVNKVDRVVDTPYKKSVKKGPLLIEYLDNPSRAKEKAVSPFNYSDLAKWGWEKETREDNSNDIRSLFGNSELAHVDLSKGWNFIWRQSLPVTVNGVYYPATDASYDNVYFPVQGIILASNNMGPNVRIERGQSTVPSWEDEQGSFLPVVELSHWSDVAALSWFSCASEKQARNLKWVIKKGIRNLDVMSMITEVMLKKEINGKEYEEDGTKLMRAPPWPGFTVERGEDGFNALLASPSCCGVAWMLVQHEGRFGRKTIKTITAFDELKGQSHLPYWPTILVEIGEGRGVYEGT